MYLKTNVREGKAIRNGQKIKLFFEESDQELNKFRESSSKDEKVTRLRLRIAIYMKWKKLNLN